jgi:hypothetical protein
MKAEPYVYSITNRDTKEFYFGSRWANVRLNRLAKDDFWIHYKSSSKKVKKAILEGGEEKFVGEILKTFETYDEAYWEEQKLIKQNIKNPLCLNEHFIDPDSKRKIFGVSGPKSLEHRQKIGERGSKTKQAKHALLSVEEHEAFSSKMSEAQTSRPEEIKLKHAKKISEAWKKQSPEQKDLISKKFSLRSKEQFSSLSDADRVLYAERTSLGLANMPQEKKDKMKAARLQTIADKSEAEKKRDIDKWKLTNSSKSDEEKKAIRLQMIQTNANKSAEQKSTYSKKLSEALKGKCGKQVICPHCGKEGSNKVMGRWHFDKCKVR